jgi:hypothetical protein
MTGKTAVELVKSYDHTDNRVVRVLRAQYEIGQGALFNFEHSMVKDALMAFYWSETAILGAAMMELALRMAQAIDQGTWGSVDIEHAAGIIEHLTVHVTHAAQRVDYRTNNQMADIVRLAGIKAAADLLAEIKQIA